MKLGRIGFRAITVLASKGGTGKTTVALHLAAVAQARGVETVVLDSDPQRSASDWAAVRKVPRPQVVRLRPDHYADFHAALMRSPVSLLIIDTPPSGGPMIQQAIRSADLNLLICRPTSLDVWAVERSADLVRRLEARAEVVINQAPPYRSGMEVTSMLAAVEELQRLGLPVAPIGLRTRAAFSDAMKLGLTASESEPTSVAAREIGRLWDHVSQALWGAPSPASPAEVS
jgi:chromosome partitioning protein